MIRIRHNQDKPMHHHNPAAAAEHMMFVIKKRSELICTRFFKEFVQKFEDLEINKKVDMVRDIAPIRKHLNEHIIDAWNEMSQMTTEASMKNMYQKVETPFCDGRFYIFSSKKGLKYFLDILNMNCCRIY